MIKGSMHEYITIINTYVPNNKVPNFMKQKLIEVKGERDNSTMSDTLIPHLQSLTFT